MSFEAKKDWFEFIDGAGVVCTDSTENKSAQVANATDAGGSIVATEVYAELLAPSCTYAVGADYDVTTAALGAMSRGTGQVYNICLTGMTITLAKGSAPTITISGEQVESMTTGGKFNKYVLPEFTIPFVHAAADILAAITLTGAGCHLQSVTLTFGCTLSKATKDGAPIAHDVSEGKIECAYTIVQSGATEPTVVADSEDGWKLTSPLTKSATDATFPTWTCTATKALVKTQGTI